MNDPDRRRSPDGFDDDAIFADIVAHLNDVVTEDEPAPSRPTPAPAPGDEPAPAAEDAVADLEVPDRATGEDPAEPTQPPPAEEGQRDLRRWFIGVPPELPELPELPSQSDPQTAPAPLPWRGQEVDHEPEEHFEPPPATPLPAGDLQFWAILAGMGGGPLLLLYLVFFNREASGYWILTAIALSVGGFALLVSRMPGHHDGDDDGARL